MVSAVKAKSSPVCSAKASSSETIFRTWSTVGNTSVNMETVDILPCFHQLHPPPRTSIIVLHLCIALSWLPTVLFKSNFDPISRAVLIPLYLIPSSRFEAHRNRNTFDGIQFACQVCAICRHLLLKPCNSCATVLKTITLKVDRPSLHPTAKHPQTQSDPRRYTEYTDKPKYRSLQSIHDII